MTDAVETEDRAKKDRSPSFPFISLPKAIERARVLSENHKRSPARLLAVAPSWGYGAKSSGLLQTVAALKQYGLIDDLGSGDDRKIVLSDLAWKILVDARLGAKEQAIRDAALKPRLIAEYAQTWLPERPSDSHCISELHLDRGFTPEAAKTFLRVFDEAVSFANLKNGDSLSSSETDKATAPKSVPEVGDLVQWESQGAFQFPQPRLVREVRRDSKVGAFVFVEGSSGGLPVEQVHIMQKASAPPEQVLAPPATYQSPPPMMAGGGANRATFPLPEGLVALELPGTLSPESYEDLKAWIEVMLRRARRSVPGKTVDD